MAWGTPLQKLGLNKELEHSINSVLGVMTVEGLRALLDSPELCGHIAEALGLGAGEIDGLRAKADRVLKERGLEVPKMHFDRALGAEFEDFAEDDAGGGGGRGREGDDD